MFSGLMICDIADHLPVFILHDNKVNICNVNSKQTKRRIKTKESINELKNDLNKQDWSMVYREQDVDLAYDTFFEMFMEIYNKHCPVINNTKKNKFEKCPWMTKGLQNACKKKNKLYKVFIRLKTKESEIKY